MARGLLVMGGVAAVSGACGLTLLLRPAVGRRLLGIGESAEATYALRIVGMMATALGLFLGGFAAMFHIASGP